MSKKTKITDADVIDVIINYYMDVQTQARAALESRLKKMRERYQAALLALAVKTTRGRALLKSFPEAKATRMSSYNGYHIHLRYQNQNDRRQDDEMSAEITITSAAAKRVKQMERDIEITARHLNEMRPSNRIAWKRRILADVLKEYPNGVGVVRKVIEQAATKLYATLPPGRQAAVQAVTGVPAPTAPSTVRKLKRKPQ